MVDEVRQFGEKGGIDYDRLRELLEYVDVGINEEEMEKVISNPYPVGENLGFEKGGSNVEWYNYETGQLLGVSSELAQGEPFITDIVSGALESHSGDYMLAMEIGESGPGSEVYVYYDEVILANPRYPLVVDFWAINTPPPSTKAIDELHVGFVFYDSEMTEIGTGWSKNLLDYDDPLEATWKEFSAMIEPPNGSTYAKLMFKADGDTTNDAAFVDDISISKAHFQRVITRDKNFPGLEYGRQTVASSGTAEPLNDGDSIPIPDGAVLVVRALKDNTGTVYVGDSEVETATGFPIYPGDAEMFKTTDVSNIYVDADNDGDTVAWQVEVEPYATG